jgi:regulatory factor X
VSFYEADMHTSQQDPSHDDSGIGMLEDGIDAKFASQMQHSLKTHLSQSPHPMLSRKVD